MMKRDSPLLEVDDLRVHYPARQRGMGRKRDDGCAALNGVSFSLDRGDTLGIVGESGCGKSTLARALVRLVDVTAGRITLDGHDVLAASGASLRSLQRVGQLVFQDVMGSLNPRLTVGASIAEPLVIHRVGNRQGRRAAVRDLLGRVGLDESYANRYPHELSGGQRQRIGLARAIALEPKLLICDEPVSALDVSMQAQILNLLSELGRSLSLTMLFISHDLGVVRHLCDRVAVMYSGTIVEMANAEDLFSSPRHPYTKLLLASVPRIEPGQRRTNAILPGGWVGSNRPKVGCALQARCPWVVDQCRKESPTLRSFSGAPSSHVAACHRRDEPLDGQRWNADVAVSSR